MYSFVVGNYFVKSHGNGWAYEIEDINTGETLFFQDDDAHNLYMDTNRFENTVAIESAFEGCY